MDYFKKGLLNDWVMQNTDERLVAILSEELSFPPWFSRVLVNRGYKDKDSATYFLDVHLNKLPDPNHLPNMEIAVQALADAVTSRKRIAVYGDYDVDGITGATILCDFLKKTGAIVYPVIPNRFLHGYGLHKQIINELYKKEITHLITVDCGITNDAEVAYASGLGIETIITDHHQIGDTLPEAKATVDPQLIFTTTDGVNDVHGLRNLAGVGVAFYLTMALRRELRNIGFWKKEKEPDLRQYLDLVALGTIADQVPLVGVNRILTKYGLSRLESSTRPGIRALMEACKLEKKKPSVWDVGFLLAPRINAAGRLGYEKKALELLLTENFNKARRLAAELERLNAQRQTEEEIILDEALNELEKNRELNNLSCIVLAKNDWNRGIIGIVASRLVERFRKPAILLALHNDFLEGSARSVSPLNIFKALQHCRAYLEKFGGHNMAAGLKLSPEKLNEFRLHFNEIVSETIPPHGIRNKLVIDSMLTLDDITHATMELLQKLSPFGPGNPRPVFLLESFDVKDRRILKEKHLSLRIHQKGKLFRGIGFNLVNPSCLLPERIEKLAFFPIFNHWEGNTYIDLRIVDFC